MILVSFGTRPEYIKIKPILEEFDKEGIEYRTLCVAQHTTLLNELSDLKLPVKGHGDNRLDSIVTSVLNNDNIFGDIKYVMVQGDTTAAMSMALAAFHRKIPVIHIEAGLRTFDKDNPYPEESNRKIISAVASYHMCPTKVDKLNLIVEGTKPEHVFVTGNTSIDNLKDIEPSVNNEVIVTHHRRENHNNMETWFRAIDKLAQETFYDFVFPMHPNPNVQKYKGVFKSVSVCDPLPFDEMKQRLADCKAVITDSGGIQEECSWFNKVCFVCREVTERKSDSSVMCQTPDELLKNFRKIEQYKVDYPCHFGDGFAAEKIVDAIKNF